MTGVGERKGAVTAARVFAGLGALCFLLVLAALYGYYGFLHYERVAARHLPADVSAALRIDVERVVLFDPVRRHLLPLVSELGPEGTAAPANFAGSRLARFEEATGMRLGADLRELVWASGPAASDWILVIGGKFPRAGLVVALEKVLAEEGFVWVRRGSELEAPTGLALGQAADGVLILASSLVRLRIALEARDAYRDMGVALEGAGGFFLRGPAPTSIRALAPWVLGAGARDLLEFSNARGEIRLASGAELYVTVELSAGADPARARDALVELAKTVATLPNVLGPGMRELLPALEHARVDIEGGSALRVVVEFDHATLDRTAQAVARALKGV